MAAQVFYPGPAQAKAYGYLKTAMETIDSLRRKIAVTGDLQEVVKTMKTLAAVSIRQYEKAVESLG